MLTQQSDTIEGVKKKMERVLKVLDFTTLQDYREIWEFQKKLVEERIKDNIPDHLLLLEHKHVITTGKHADFRNLKLSSEELLKMGIDLYKIERGGDITYHGPGQIVGYPIIKINSAIAGLRKFIHMLENALMSTIERYGIKTYTTDKYVGVWHKDEKIVAIGVAFKRWVSYHGFAFNVNTDLSYFDLIIPCGLEDKGVTSLKKLTGKSIPIEEVKKYFASDFAKVFGYDKVEYNSLQHPSEYTLN